MSTVALRKGPDGAGGGHVGSTMMSMYSDLLAATLSTRPEEPGDASAGELLAALIDARRRLAAVSPTVGPSTPTTALAAHIEYDAALIAFCEARDIDTHPDRFGTPGSERRRLEEELARAGIDVEALTHASGGPAPPTSPGRDRSDERAR
ncbi:MAG TPA: hypothetical protein VLZ77_08395 [Acidimicrobiales bacterium]|nr:hypothetical protein [Acidimicrobiales bacterium]